jgi:putative ABC transport system permease protein
VRSWNSEKEFRKIESLFSAIKILSWFVGLMTLLAGVLGVSNIMLIAVKERTKEIGLRRAVGARPSAIVAMIVQENIALTSIAGVSGLIAAVSVLSASAQFLSDSSTIMGAPAVELNVAIWATVILMILGLIAAIMPARAALNINPIEALRME